MATQHSQRTLDRMRRFEEFLQTLANDGLTTLAPPFELPTAHLGQCTVLGDKWDVADRWLSDVTYVGSPHDTVRNHEAFPQIATLKQRVAEWRRQERI